jgi:hypothetical protein
MNASCSGCSSPSCASPSIVVTSRPSHCAAKISRDKTCLPSSSTVHVPHAPWSQPFFVPVQVEFVVKRVKERDATVRVFGRCGRNHERPTAPRGHARSRSSPPVSSRHASDSTTGNQDLTLGACHEDGRSSLWHPRGRRSDKKRRRLDAVRPSLGPERWWMTEIDVASFARGGCVVDGAHAHAAQALDEGERLGRA